MTLPAYLRIFRERWKVIFAVLILGVLAAAGITALSPKVYQATAQVFVAPNLASVDPSQQSQAGYFVQTQVATYADTVDSPTLLQQVRDDLNLNLSNNDLAAKVFATSPAQRSLVNVAATDASPGQAAAIANSAARAFVDLIQANTTPPGSTKPSVLLKVTSPATAPTVPVSPRTTLNITLGVLIGLLAGIALAVARDVLDNRVKTLEQFAAVTSKPAMGVIVEDSEVGRQPMAMRGDAHSLRAENFRQLRANLQFANVDSHPRVIAVASSIPGEGKTMVAVNLASTLAEAGFTVCLVDADLRRPTVAKVLGLPGVVGLTSILIQQIDVDEALQTAGPNLMVLTSGPIPPNPAEVLASVYVRDIVRSLLDRVDYVVIDTAPLLPVADGTEVAALADGTLFVARHKVTTEQQVRRAIASLERVAAPVLGVVLNRVPTRRNSEYSYTYYRSESSNLPKNKKAKTADTAAAEPPAALTSAE